MTMGDGIKVIGKVGKEFEPITKAYNMRLHPRGVSLRDNSAMDIIRDLMRDFYYDGREIEILSLTKSDVDKDFAFITSPSKMPVKIFSKMASLTIPSVSKLVQPKTKTRLIHWT